MDHYTPTVQNCIDQLNFLKTALVNELINYTQNPKHNKLYVDIKQKQIELIDSVCGMFTHVYNGIKDEFLNQELRFIDQKKNVFRLEACAFFYGISWAELANFTRMPLDKVEENISNCINQKWRQVPLMFQPFIDKNAAYNTFNDQQINVDRTGKTTYSLLNTNEPKTALTPFFDWSQLKKH